MSKGKSSQLAKLAICTIRVAERGFKSHFEWMQSRFMLANKAHFS